MSAAAQVLSVLMVVIGLAMIVRTVVEVDGGASLPVGLLLGVLFVAAGGGRLWAERHR